MCRSGVFAVWRRRGVDLAFRVTDRTQVPKAADGEAFHHSIEVIHESTDASEATKLAKAMTAIDRQSRAAEARAKAGRPAHGRRERSAIRKVPAVVPVPAADLPEAAIARAVGPEVAGPSMEIDRMLLPDGATEAEIVSAWAKWTRPAPAIIVATGRLTEAQAARFADVVHRQNRCMIAHGYEVAHLYTWPVRIVRWIYRVILRRDPPARFDNFRTIPLSGPVSTPPAVRP